MKMVRPRQFYITIACLAGVTPFGSSYRIAFVPFMRSNSHTSKWVSKRAHDVKLYSKESDSISRNSKTITVYEYNEEDQRFNKEIFANSNCWGRRPFLMRGAFDPESLMAGRDEYGDAAWPSWDDIVDIASDDESESRVISYEPGDNNSYELQWGPLMDKDVEDWFSTSKTRHDNVRKRTLVVNDIDRFYPPLADWMHDNFKFLPNWRMDDCQISLAEDMGGIGPHVDNYDVFLIQMSGSRRWQVGCEKLSTKIEISRSIPHLDVRVLDRWGENDEFEDWILQPGDMLYLPPRIAHCGTALTDDCMTLSVGCRAPSVSDLVSRLAENLALSTEDIAVRRYSDEDLLSRGFSTNFLNGHLTHEAKHKARQLVLESVNSMLENDDWWDIFFGKYVTEQKRVRLNYPISLDDEEGDNSLETSIIQSVLKGETVLVHAEGIPFAYSCVTAKDTNQIAYRLFANGDMWQYDSQNTDHSKDAMACLFTAIANHRRLDKALLLKCIDNDVNLIGSDAVKFLEMLVRIGVIYATERH